MARQGAVVHGCGWAHGHRIFGLENCLLLFRDKTEFMIIKMCIKLLNLMPNSKLKTPTELKIKKHRLFDVINSIWLVSLSWIHVSVVLFEWYGILCSAVWVNK